MVNQTQTQTHTGIGWMGLLQIILIILKLNPGGLVTTAVVGWSWWLVFTPLWVSLALFVIALAVFAVVVWLDKR